MTQAQGPLELHSTPGSSSLGIKYNKNYISKGHCVADIVATRRAAAFISAAVLGVHLEGLR